MHCHSLFGKSRFVASARHDMAVSHSSTIDNAINVGGAIAAANPIAAFLARWKNTPMGKANDREMAKRLSRQIKSSAFTCTGPARFRLPISKAIPAHNTFCATLTSAQPARHISTIFGARKNCQFSTNLTCQVNQMTRSHNNRSCIKRTAVGKNAGQAMAVNGFLAATPSPTISAKYQTSVQ
jgi:hypothetical protein